MKMFGCRIAYFFAVVLLVLVCFQDLELGSSFNVEGRRVLGLWEEPKVDPHELVSNRRVEVDEDHDRCSRVGVLCIDGRVVSLSESSSARKYGTGNIRERLQTNRRNIFWSVSDRKLREISPADQVLFVKFSQHTFMSPQSLTSSRRTPFPLIFPPPFPSPELTSQTNPSDGVPPVNNNVDTSAHAPSSSSSPPPTANGPLQPPYDPANPPPKSNPPPYHHGQDAPANGLGKQILPLVIGIVIGAVLLVLAAILVVFCRNKKVVDIKPPIKEGLSGQLRKALVTGVPALNRSELESACEDFSNEIGSLSDGKLYKGTLSAGVEIAVNVIELGRNWASHHEDQFKKKISVMSKVNHKNFVNLIGYCEEEEPLSRMVIFEYASNGTLFEHLHPKEEDSDSLTWPQRSRIAMGAAYCLTHMHQLDPPVILQNLDSSSILLTDDFAAKIADMELQSQTTCIKTRSRNPGILLEEQMQKQQSLVHKYGTLLLELISGRPPNSNENGGLVNWALDHLNGTKPLEEILDPTLTSFPADKLRSICHVVESCLNPDPKRRPSMQDVTAQLREITGVTPDAAAPRLSPSWWTELEMVSLAVHPKME